MILAQVRIGDDTYDWFDGECEFPVLPPIGSTVEITDKNANMRELTVKDIIIEGVKSETKAELPATFGKQTITLITSEF